MRVRSLALLALLALPSWSSAQRIPVPRIHRRVEPRPAPLPPQPPIIANQLAYRRSLWSFESAPVVTHMELPAATGGTAVYTTLGTSDHADYRLNDHYAATVDFGASTDFGSAVYLLTELGTRYRPLGLDSKVRPYFDLRGGYMFMYDQYAGVAPNGSAIAEQQFIQGGRFANGFGASAGAGFEYPLTRSLALTTELTGMRSLLRAYHTSGPAGFPNNEGRYWMTSVRYMFGFKYNAVRLYRAVQSVQQVAR